MKLVKFSEEEIVLENDNGEQFTLTADKKLGQYFLQDIIEAILNYEK